MMLILLGKKKDMYQLPAGGLNWLPQHSRIIKLRYYLKAMALQNSCINVAINTDQEKGIGNR